MTYQIARELHMTRARLLAEASSQEIEEWRAFLTLEHREHKLLRDGKLQPEIAHEMIWSPQDGQ